MKVKAGSLKRSGKLISLQQDSSRKKKERTQIIEIRNKKGEVKMDITEIQRVMDTTTINYMPIK